MDEEDINEILNVRISLISDKKVRKGSYSPLEINKG